MTIQFIGYTLGLECWVNGQLKLVTVEISRSDKGVRLRAVSGHNLSRLPSLSDKWITEKDYNERPIDPYNKACETIWALDLLGLIPALLDN